MGQEFSTRLHTEVQSIAKEVEVVKKRTDMELANCVRDVGIVCDEMNEGMNAYKSRPIPASTVAG